MTKYTEWQDQEIMAEVRKVGSVCFVLYIPLWLSDESNVEAAAKLRKDSIQRGLNGGAGYSATSCGNRTATARRIIQKGNFRRALELVATMNLKKFSDEDLSYIAKIMAQGVL